jgi:hypothetical protein
LVPRFTSFCLSKFLPLLFRFESCGVNLLKLGICCLANYHVDMFEAPRSREVPESISERDISTIAFSAKDYLFASGVMTDAVKRWGRAATYSWHAAGSQQEYEIWRQGQGAPRDGLIGRGVWGLRTLVNGDVGPDRTRLYMDCSADRMGLVTGDSFYWEIADPVNPERVNKTMEIILDLQAEIALRDEARQPHFGAKG